MLPADIACPPTLSPLSPLLTPPCRFSPLPDITAA
jgi:hypothetical protein